ncbi:MAG: RsmE family RNA methyltransferase [Planctomycetota bacterium]
MSRRYFSQEPIAFTEGQSCVMHLDGPETHHLLKVMRLNEGDQLVLFDGSGDEFDTELLEAPRRGPARLLVRSRQKVDREAPIAVTLGVALPKGDRQKVLVEKLTELGVRRLVPLVTEHSVAAPKASGLEKLRRGVIEASKQCGRNVLMQIEEPIPLASFLTETEAERRLIAHPSGEPLTVGRSFAPVAVAIGPEGGFSDTEVANATDAGWESVAIGRSILRIETAAIACAALLRG